MVLNDVPYMLSEFKFLDMSKRIFATSTWLCIIAKCKGENPSESGMNAKFAPSSWIPPSEGVELGKQLADICEAMTCGIKKGASPKSITLHED